MASSVLDPEVREALEGARRPGVRTVMVDGRAVEVPSPFPSPADWRDSWIYFLMTDRFDNPDAPPRAPWDAPVGDFQGGTFAGVRRRLGYLQRLGVGAIWLTPVLKNCQYLPDTFHGYGIQDFLAVEPRLASNRADPEGELRDLIDEAHARGIHVILDVVLNHAGDVFAYRRDEGGFANAADWREGGYAIGWRGGDGAPVADWAEAPAEDDPRLTRDAAVWPRELRDNALFRRKGRGGEAGGDFESLKEMVTAEARLRNALILIHQYLIAAFDVDGFRIDTLKYIEPDFARTFGNAMREFALGIGKKNFFTFGEVFDSEEKIAHFIGRNALEPGDMVGVDAALDFPLFYVLPGVAKGLMAPSVLAQVYEHRKRVQRGIVSSHGEASRFFVTFLDNHDMRSRFRYRDPADPQRFDDQATLGLACLFALQGIPCLYYGTEQGLSGAGDSDRAVREALWGRPGAFDPEDPFYRTVARLAELRAAEPALRYGRQYFRPVSGDGASFGLSTFDAGAVAFSRILNDRELLVAANTDTRNPLSLSVIVDASLNPAGAAFRVLFSNRREPAPPAPVAELQGATVREVNGATSRGPVRALRIELAPMEAQILGR